MELGTRPTPLKMSAAGAMEIDSVHVFIRECVFIRHTVVNTVTWERDDLVSPNVILASISWISWTSSYMSHLDLISQGHRGQLKKFISISCEQDNIVSPNFVCLHASISWIPWTAWPNFQGHRGQLSSLKWEHNNLRNEWHQMTIILSCKYLMNTLDNFCQIDLLFKVTGVKWENSLK
jgi:hypothetical protein